jgi:hypothetical protein
MVVQLVKSWCEDRQQITHHLTFTLDPANRDHPSICTTLGISRSRPLI